MTAVLSYLRSLEGYVEQRGARVVRTELPEWVQGRLFCDLISLRADLTPEQELQTLVHEVAHWLAHRDACPGPYCTVYEYEAEAVEALVMARLGLPHPAPAAADCGQDGPTDGLLSASVARVVWASNRICAALGLSAALAESMPQAESEPQAAVQFNAAAREEIVLKYEPHGMCDFVGLAQPL